LRKVGDVAPRTNRIPMLRGGKKEWLDNDVVLTARILQPVYLAQLYKRGLG
jgi:hypothetical protein